MAQKFFIVILIVMCIIFLSLACTCLPSPSDAAIISKADVGINIGNTLDSIGTSTWTAGETGWGNPVITQDFIKALANYGYKRIRLPVTWAENIGPAPDYTITKAWMDRVEEVVNWIIGEDMYCIVNLHHDGGSADKSWILNMAAQENQTLDEYTKVWSQIAQRFRDTSDKLILESMNEVGFDGISKSEAYRKLNLLNQTFVDTVRASGSINAVRPLLIAGYWTDIDETCDPLFAMPQDSAAGKLILSVHYYTPATFCIAEETNNSWGFKADWGSGSSAEADYNELNTQFNKLKTTFIDRGIPVIVGEYGVTMKNKIEAGRIRWMTAVTQICLDNGICPILWDTGGEIKRMSPFEMSASLKQVWKNIKAPD